MDALEETLTKYGTPEIVNTDQESQFTSTAFTNMLHHDPCVFPGDGCGRLRDNVGWRRAPTSFRWLYSRSPHSSYESVGGYLTAGAIYITLNFEPAMIQ